MCLGMLRNRSLSNKGNHKTCVVRKLKGSLLYMRSQGWKKGSDSISLMGILVPFLIRIKYHGVIYGDIRIYFSHRLPPTFFKSIYLTVPRSLIKDVRNQLTKLIKNDPNTADQNP